LATAEPRASSTHVVTLLGANVGAGVDEIGVGHR
jgi:hypothetical protein